jgi:hypothetical protein
MIEKKVRMNGVDTVITVKPVTADYADRDLDGCKGKGVQAFIAYGGVEKFDWYEAVQEPCIMGTDIVIGIAKDGTKLVVYTDMFEFLDLEPVRQDHREIIESVLPISDES